MRHKRMTQQYTLDGDETPSEGVYSAVAAVKECSPLELPPLAETIDPDALDTALTNERQPAEISLRYCAYAVDVTPDEVHVQPVAAD